MIKNSGELIALAPVADLGGGARGAIAPPFLKSQEVQKNECIDIRTQ